MATAIWNEKEKRWKIDATKDGRRKVFTSRKPGRTGKIEAKRKYNTWMDGEEDGGNIKIQAAWDNYLADTKARCSISAYITTEKIGKCYILPTCKNYKIGTMKVTDWQKIINESHGIRVAELSKKTVSNIKGTIITFCHYCKRAGYIDTVPEELYLPRGGTKKGKPILTPVQMKSLFDQSEEWYINSWRLMAVLGLRPGECYAIQDADIKDGILYISRAVDPHGNITEGKTINARRAIALPDIAQEIINNQINKLGGMERACLFPNLKGMIPHPTWTYRQWKSFCKTKGFDVPLYSLRHTWISIMKNEIPNETLKLWVGHASSMDTFGVYGHELTGEKKESSKIVDLTMKNYIAK